MKKAHSFFPIDLRSFLTITILFTGLSFWALFYLCSQEVASGTQTRNIEEKMHNKINSKTAGFNLKDVFIELRIFANHYEVKQFLLNRNQKSRQRLEAEALNLCKASKHFDQVRLLSNDGMELVRVNYNNGNPVIVSQDKLQSKSSRYYFKESLKLSPGEIYTSPLDLNIENGKIEQPRKPTIRISTPVYSDSGERIGITILNYLAQNLLDAIKQEDYCCSKTILLNKEGYWLISPDKELEWTFMYEDKKSISFASRYPEAWAKISSSPQGQFYCPEGEYTFSTVQTSSDPSESAVIDALSWKLVNIYPTYLIETKKNSIFKKYTAIFTGLFLLILFAAITRARFVRSKELGRISLKQAKQEAENANKAKSDFLAKMSHEIRTPMNAVIGLTHLALKTTLSPKQTDYLNKISMAANSLLGIINDILDFSKIEANQMEVDSIEFNIDDVLNNITSMLSIKAEEKGIELLLQVISNVPSRLIGDPLRLGQVLLNLIGNAIKFTEKGEVFVTVELVERSNDIAVIRFSIEDSGIGISEEQLGRLFQPFSQADGSITRKFGGSGLGLVISKKMIELMGGSLQCESVIDEGSTFSFTIPFTFQAVHKDSFFTYPDDIRGIRVLIVDSSKASRGVLANVLKSFSFDVTIAESGKQALKLLHENDTDSPFRMVITDWKIHDMNGIELTRRIKTSKNLQYRPKVIMLTAYSYADVRFQAEQAELDDFMLKPFNRSILFDTIMENFNGNRPTSKMKQKSSKPNNLPENIIGAKVLLAEDTLINQQVAQEILEDAGIIVDIASNGKEAIETLENNVYDAILMDIQMPEMDGFQAVKIIRNRPKIKDIPIIAMTAHALVGDKEKSLLMGMDDHITKPIDPDLLIETLSKWLPKKTNHSGRSPERPQFPDGQATDIPNLPGIDTEKGMHRVRGNTKLYLKLLGDFAKNSSDKQTELLESITNKTYVNTRAMAHSMKGVAGNLGIDNLHGILQEMEALSEQETDIGEPIIQKFKDEIQRVAKGILEFLPQQDEDTTIAVSINVKTINNLRPELEKIADLLEQHDVEAKAIFATLKPSLAQAAPVETAELAGLLDRFDFAKAHQKIKELFQQCQEME
ncbi:response regulator [Maridesulfovibrio sp.]|uniref:response regulator n=1 Tax=Maridesulfovibrio sp. TaxID=2795000 RepID=UPI0029F5B82C|nr:response regulator [Maridesulfovibrio sp.]